MIMLFFPRKPNMYTGFLSVNTKRRIETQNLDTIHSILNFIKTACRVLLILCILLSISMAAGGCGGSLSRQDPIANVEPENQPLRLESAELRPIIHGSEISGSRYPLEEGSIHAVANGFSLDLVFSDSLDPEQISSAVQIIGLSEVVFSAVQPEPSVTGNDRIIQIYAPEIEAGTYQLIIAAGLTGSRSLPLEELISLSLELSPQTEGEFFLLDSSGYPRPISYEECRYGLALSDTAKTFLIHFNQEVNRLSVEDSLLAGLKEQPVIAAFSWQTPQQLRVNLTQLQTGMNYNLLLESGIDNRGNSILGSCVFRTGKASNVGVIQLETNDMTMIYQFSEERYSGIRSQIINSRILLQAGSSLTWSFGLGARQLFSLPSLRYDLALPQSYREPVWLDYDHLFGYNASDRSLLVVSVTEGTAEPVYTLPDRPLECRLSPNGRLLAVTVRNPKEDRQVDLLLIDVQQKAFIHQVSEFARPYTTPTGFITINLTWSGNDALIYVDNDDISRVYLSPDGKVMERVNTIERDSRIMDYLQEQNLLLYRPARSGADSLYLMQDNKSRRLKDIFPDESDFYCVLVDEDTILYQMGDEIYRYAINEQTSELIGSGLLLGVSSARDRAYYMINAEDYSRAAP